MKKNITLTIVLLLSCSFLAQAKAIPAHLSEQDIARLKVIKEKLVEVETKSLRQLIEETEKASYPQVNLAIKEAMANTYTDIIQEEKVEGKAKREWVYSMVALNMAYFQFAGAKDSAGGVKNLNKLIRYKLKTYLPPHIFNQPGFHCSIE